MLLCIKMQATLKLVKDTRAGTCFLKDCGQCVPLYEIVGSDLRCICISNWDVTGQKQRCFQTCSRQDFPTSDCSTSLPLRLSRVEEEPMEESTRLGIFSRRNARWCGPGHRAAGQVRRLSRAAGTNEFRQPDKSSAGKLRQTSHGSLCSIALA